MTKRRLWPSRDGRRHFGFPESKPSCESLTGHHLALRRRAPQQPIVKKVETKIRVKYQLVNRDVGTAANLAAFHSACPPLIAALRGACHPDKSVPAMPKSNSGTGFLAAEMKEYDA